MNWRKKFSGITLRLMFLTLISILPFIILYIFYFNSIINQKINDRKAEALKTAELTATSVSNYVSKTRTLLFSLVNCSEVNERNSIQISRLFREITKEYKIYNNIGLTQPDGLNIATAIPLSSPVYSSDKPWFKRVQQENKFIIGDFQLGKITKKPGINFAMPLPNQPKDKPVWAIYVAMNLDDLSSSIAKIRGYEADLISIIDRNGTIVARSQDNNLFIGKKSYIWDEFIKDSAQIGRFFEEIGNDGIKRLFNCIEVPETNRSLFVVSGFSKNRIESEAKSIFYKYLLFLFISIVITMIMAYLIARNSIIKQIGLLSSFIKRYAEGEKNINFEITNGIKEIQDFSKTFNDISLALQLESSKLKEKSEELLASNLNLESEIQNRIIVEKSLRENELKLEELNSTKDKFFSIIAHDLKSPLGNFKEMTKLMVEEYEQFSENERIEFLKIIKISSNSIYELLENLLLWSRSQRGLIPFSPQIIDVSKCINNSIELFEISTRNKNITIINKIESSLLIFADIDLLTTILRNLISNAIKFTNLNGIIEIGSKKLFNSSEDSVECIYIKDNGIGIPEDILDNLFLIGSNVSRNGTEGESSTGLGLILCNDFIKLQGGKLWVESEVGIGSTFYFALPVNIS
jgi:signal transduction histidine kinase